MEDRSLDPLRHSERDSYDRDKQLLLQEITSLSKGAIV
jgi:hypothetical protein